MGSAGAKGCAAGGAEGEGWATGGIGAEDWVAGGTGADDWAAGGAEADDWTAGDTGRAGAMGWAAGGVEVLDWAAGGDCIACRSRSCAPGDARNDCKICPKASMIGIEMVTSDAKGLLWNTRFKKVDCR